MTDFPELKWKTLIIESGLAKAFHEDSGLLFTCRTQGATHPEIFQSLLDQKCTINPFWHQWKQEVFEDTEFKIVIDGTNYFLLLMWIEGVFCANLRTEESQMSVSGASTEDLKSSFHVSLDKEFSHFLEGLACLALHEKELIEIK